jgi:PleD family two-component response regulator
MAGQGVRVLDVGQCNLDHTNISRLLQENFAAAVDRAASPDQVFYMVGYYDYDLVLVNRILDADGSEGLALIKRMKEDEATRELPVMLISDLEDAQALAEAAGAVPGFGKKALNDPRTVELLSQHLQPARS